VRLVQGKVSGRTTVVGNRRDVNPLKLACLPAS
jgi:hypothetical protein